MRLFNFFVLILVIYMNSPAYLSDYIYTLVDFHLNDSLTINVTVFAEELKGLMLYGVDSYRNIFEVKFTEEFNRTKFIRIKLNDLHKGSSLNDTCQCHLCNFKFMNISIKISKDKVNMTCNGGKEHSMITGYNKDQKRTEFFVPLPIQLVNTTKRMFIIMGNSGPYTDFRNGKTMPMKDQMSGCVNDMLVNNTAIVFNATNDQFNTTDNRMKNKCTKQCVRDKICNKGFCVETYTRVLCNCSLIPFNGQYCNDSLKIFKRREKIGYLPLPEVREVSMKMTWNKSGSLTKYCLLEFINDATTRMLQLQYNTLLMDGGNTVTFDKVGLNFATVKIYNGKLSYEVNNKSAEVNFPFSDKTQINVGFSDRGAKCETFEGQYDVYAIPTQLRGFFMNKSSDKTTIAPTFVTSDYFTNSSNSSSIKAVKSTNYLFGSLFSRLGNTHFLFIGIGGFVILYVGTTLTFVLMKRRSKRRKKRVLAPEGLMEVADDEYCDNPEFKNYNFISLEGIYTTGTTTYSLYNQSTSYPFDDEGPQLPPRDENPVNNAQWLEFSTDYNSIKSSHNVYNKIEYQGVYMRVEDDEYARVRYKLEDTEDSDPQLPPRD